MVLKCVIFRMKIRNTVFLYDIITAATIPSPHLSYPTLKSVFIGYLKSTSTSIGLFCCRYTFLLYNIIVWLNVFTLSYPCSPFLHGTHASRRSACVTFPPTICPAGGHQQSEKVEKGNGKGRDERTKNSRQTDAFVVFVSELFRCLRKRMRTVRVRTATTVSLVMLLLRLRFYLTLLEAGCRSSSRL